MSSFVLLHSQNTKLQALSVKLNRPTLKTLAVSMIKVTLELQGTNEV